MSSTTLRRGFLNSVFAPPSAAVHPTLLAVAAACAAALGGIYAVVVTSQQPQLDVSIERFIQSLNFGPLAMTFPFISWAGGPGGVYMQAAALVVVLVLNRRAWLPALAAMAGGFSYFLLVGLAHRPRPTAGVVLRVAEHPGGWSFPSGHVIFIGLTLGMVMLCVGHRYLPSWARPIGWAAVAAVVLIAGLSRIYVGAHWPSDVAASLCIAVGWVAAVASVRWMSDRALYRDAA